MSQDELAEATGLWQGTISRMENGWSPAASTVKKLSEYFDVPGEWLMGLDVPARNGEKDTEPQSVGVAEETAAVM
jgi:transcriptional regulator with XRE-family HTH domain